MVTIIFEPHSTTFNNEAHIASGWDDVELSPLGTKQAKELGERREGEYFDAIFCSDLKRSYKTADIAFNGKFPVIKDKKLRECDYGDLTSHPEDEVKPLKIKYIKTSFPNGESFEQAMQRMKEFLEDLLKNYNGKKVMIIGHRATQYGLEYFINNLSLQKIITTHWFWQPGWEYKLENI
ncbi:histidine phosphatase family protein [Candidatus Daviesbacteria bacterium]|nr:histidine phosphatase family protein [Candidatus Daviesbacteria bacterium]